MPSHWAAEYYRSVDGPFAIVRGCKVKGCGFTVKTPKRANPGRGWGMREGNKLNGAIVQHIKAAHPELKPGATGAS